MRRHQTLDDAVVEDIDDDPTNGTEFGISVREADAMPENGAIRAITLLACWAGRRLQRRRDERKKESDNAVSSVNTKGYEGKISKKRLAKVGTEGNIGVTD